MSQNVQVVQELFAAFGQKDLPTLLTLLTDDVEWELLGPQELPFCDVRHGHDGVASFFQDHMGSLELTRFEIHEFLPSGDKVIVLGEEDGHALNTQKTFTNEWAMVFTLRDGKIAKWRSYENTAVMLEALRG